MTLFTKMTKNLFLNAWITIPNNWTSEILSKLDFDILTIDMQHGLIDYSDCLSIIQSIGSTKPVFVRVPWNDPGIIMKVLDAGVNGIICPMISSKTQAQDLVRYSRYSPLGERSLGPLRANLIRGMDYRKRANEEIIVLPMIETKEALNNLSEIISVDGINGIYIGTMDLSLSLGMVDLGELENPILSKALEKIVTKVKDSNLILGMHSRSPQEVKKIQSMGIQLITIINDSRLFQFAAKDILDQSREYLDLGK